MKSAGFAGAADFRAGAAAVDISPPKLPAIRNGGFLEAIWDRVADPLFARCLVLSDGSETIALAVVDSCMVPTDVCDAIKDLAAGQAGIPKDRILVSATHTHSAPSTMSMCLGTRKDEEYTAFLIPKVAGGIVAAHRAMQPAKAGSASVDAPEFTHCRRWIFRSDKMQTDPFGERSVRAMMHPGYENPDATGPAGPVDSELSVFSVVSARDASPIAVLANYSMHYFGSPGGFSADYFGEVARKLEETAGGAGVVGIVSQGTSGDLHWMDYSRPKQADFDRREYSEGLAALAVETLDRVEYRADLSLAMAEKRLRLSRRVPSAERLAWATHIDAARGDRRPKDKPEVYAEQALWIHENPETEVVLQAVRIGELAIAALPNEVYGITGLKLKAQSPLANTFNIELANGAEGYIPPREQHALGGYTTWPARTAGLEVAAESKIAEAALALLETVSGKPRRPLVDSHGDYARAVLADGPVAYWRLEDFDGPGVRNAVGKVEANFEDGIALYLPGVQRQGGAISAPPEKPSPFSGARENRAAHFAGGRIVAGIPRLGREYSVELWFWNSFPAGARPVTGYLFSRGRGGDPKAAGEHLGIGGTAKDVPAGRLFFYTGNEGGEVVKGATELAFRDWHHVVLTRKEREMRVYLDGVWEIEAEVDWTLPAEVDSLFIGGRCDRFAGFEGKIDEVAVYGEALTAEQVAGHFAASRRTARVLSKTD